MKNTVFIHTNAKQIVGAIVAAHSLKRNSATPDKFDVRIIRCEDYSFFDKKEGQTFLRGKEKRIWKNDDLQSFTPLRFMPPELMGYQGRAVIMDPDIFAVRDVNELLERDMQGKAIMAVARPGHNKRRYYIASSVMLLDCSKLTHWKCEEQFNEMFEMKRDYIPWISLELEDRSTIGLLEPEWNHFDTLNENTKLLHNTKRRTQPWKTGLPVDFTNRNEKRFGFLASQWFRAKRYLPHPDPNQEAFFFNLLGECLDIEVVSEEFVREEIKKRHIRVDALELLAQAGPAAAR